MYFPTLLTSVSVVLVGIADLTSAHGGFVDAYGDANPKIRGYGLGFEPSTPRKSSHSEPYYKQDATSFANKMVFRPGDGTVNQYGCGSTYLTVSRAFAAHQPKIWSGTTPLQKLGLFRDKVIPAAGYIDTKDRINHLASLEQKRSTRDDSATGAKGLSTGIPKVTAGGTLTIVNFQMDIDGAGPFKCKIDYKGAGNSWNAPLQVTKNCPGNAGSVNVPGILKPCWFTIAMPDGLDCKGTYGAKGEVEDICLVRCENSSHLGPFGGCVPIQQVRSAKARAM
ncbi:hypothetical protein TWF481_008544 [Arthrobotrys musiformis]|uniref:Uncharacterized protein n=1 Tax=Arthrobotrys musiformis TaxID=47236 RepID=A0AAV9W9W7_9PEZI